MTHLEENIAAAEAAEVFNKLGRTCAAAGLVEVPACMRRSFCKGHSFVPQDAEGLWSLTVKGGDNVVFLKDGTAIFGLWSPTAEGVAIPLFIQRMSADKFLQLWAEAQKQAASYGVA